MGGTDMGKKGKGWGRGDCSWDVIYERKIFFLKKMVLSSHIGAKNQTQVFLEKHPGLFTPEPPQQPLVFPS